MKIGQKVKLKNVLSNDQMWLNKYKNVIGKVIDFEARNDHDPPRFIRVAFSSTSKGGGYEDVATWRIEKV